MSAAAAGPASPLDRPLAVTVFLDRRAQEKREHLLTLRELLPLIRDTTGDAKDRLPWLKLARFGDARTSKNSLRHNANVLAIVGIEGDYDNEALTIDDAVQSLRAAGLAAMVYSSPSHTEDRPRWRALCPLSRDHLPAEREVFVARLNGVFHGGLSVESFTLSQSYYFGSVCRSAAHRVELVDGGFIDVRSDLDGSAIGRPYDEHQAVPAMHRDFTSSRFIDAVIREALAKVSNAPDGQKHHTLRAQAKVLGGFHHAGGYSRAEAIEWLIAALPPSAKDLKAARNTAAWGFEWGEAHPLEIPIRPHIVAAPEALEPPTDLELHPRDSAPSEFKRETSARALPPLEDPHSIYDPWNALHPVPFPIQMLPEPLCSFVASRAQVIGADAAALAWTCLSAASAAIDGRIRLRMKRHDPWSVPPALWTVLVGGPSTKKTPVINIAFRPLEQLQQDALCEHRAAMAAWDALPKNVKETEPKPTPPRRLVTHDATMEALQEILSNQERGIGVVRDELAGWIGSLEKYAGGKGSAADRAFALQSYNGGAHVVDRVMRGTLPINNLLCTICGGIQPDRLRQFRDLTDDGLWQRFIPHIMAPGDRGLDVPLEGPDVWHGVIQRLLDVPAATLLQLSDDAHTIREEVCDRLYELEQNEVLGHRFVGFVGKLAGIWGRLCLVLHLIAAPDRTIVKAATAELARDLVFDVILPTAARVYMEMGGAGGNAEATQSIAGYILTKSLRRLLMSDLTADVRACRGLSSDDVRRLVSPLEAGGWLQPEKEFGNTRWLVSSLVHERFADQARRESERRRATREMILRAGAHRRSRNQKDQEFDR
jgi:hypothetical protein